MAYCRLSNHVNRRFTTPAYTIAPDDHLHVLRDSETGGYSFNKVTLGRLIPAVEKAPDTMMLVARQGI